MAKKPKEEPAAASWYRVAVASVTTYRNGFFNPATWLDDLSLGNAKSFGIGWEKIVPHKNPELKGPEAMDVLVQHEVVITQHLAPPDFYRALRTHPGSRVKRAIQWLDWEAMPPLNYHSPLQKDLGAYMLARTLEGTKPNRFGKMHVDSYEMSLPDDGTGKPHVHCSDIRDTTFPAGYMDIVFKMFVPYSGLINGIFFDNIWDRPYYGTATNAPSTAELEPRFVAQCRDILTRYRKTALGEIWGNIAATQRLYPEIDTKWTELDMSNTNIAQVGNNAVASVRDGTAARGRPQALVFNTQQSSFWLNDQRNWDTLAGVCAGTEGLGVTTFRASTAALCPAQCS